MQGYFASVKPKLRQIRESYYSYTGPLRLLPDVMIIGAAKSGTTSLYRYLAKHPDVHPARKGNPDFFNVHFARGSTWYRGLFPLRFSKLVHNYLLKSKFVTLEDSPFYFVHPLAPKRAATVVPTAKLLVLLRNPIDRAYSQYHHEVRAGREPLSFEAALDAEEERLAEEVEQNKNRHQKNYYNLEHFSYKARSRYAEQINRWLKHFQLDQFHIIQSEIFYCQTDESIQQVLNFIGLQHWPITTTKVYKSGRGYPPIEDSTRMELSEYFRVHNNELFELLDRDFAWN